MDSVDYSLQDGVATICIDDGKRNALSPDVFRELYAAFDQARSDNAAVVLTGRESVFSAGFDLNVMKRGGADALRMLRAGYGLPARVLSHPRPVVVACNGHAMAMGVFLMLSADYVIGSRGDFKISANEVAIGLTMPRVAAAMLRHRLTPAAFQRAVTLSEFFDVDAALELGFFDELTEPQDVMARAESRIGEFRQLDSAAHAASKLRIRRPLIRKLRRYVWLDLFDAAMMGIRRKGPK
jgi:enoyl-CoA hydratase